MQLRKVLKEQYGTREARQRMQPINQNLKSVLCTTTGLSEGAKEVVDFIGRPIEHRLEPLVKDYPMIKCNIGKHDNRRLYHLPFDPAYDTIIIGNVEGEVYADTVAEAEAAGFKRVGT